MRVIIYRQEQGKRRLTVLPRRRARLPPVSLRGVSRAALRDAIEPVLVAVADREWLRDPQALGT